MRPNVVGDVGGGGSSQKWFNPDAFSIPSFGSYGNAGRGLVYSDGVTNVDLSLFKRIAWGEGRWVELRAEMFNMFNMTNLGTPDPYVGSPTMGRVFSTIVPMRQVQLGFKVIF